MDPVHRAGRSWTDFVGRNGGTDRILLDDERRGPSSGPRSMDPCVTVASDAACPTSRPVFRPGWIQRVGDTQRVAEGVGHDGKRAGTLWTVTMNPPNPASPASGMLLKSPDL